MPLLGISAFEVVSEDVNTEKSETLFVRTKGVVAEGYQSGGKLVVKAKSQVIKDNAPSISRGFSGLRISLIEQGVLTEQDKYFVFEQDYAFESPSTAAAVIMGRNANGRTEWKNAEGVTLKQLQEELMDQNVSG